jgi:hypothetical protein
MLKPGCSRVRPPAERATFDQVRLRPLRTTLSE